MARQLLGLTGEFPGSKRGLMVVLAEYRYALHALALQLESRERYGQHHQIDAASGGPHPRHLPDAAVGVAIGSTARERTQHQH
jgi:hypothetical protein